jgi:glyoxalase family protein
VLPFTDPEGQSLELVDDTANGEGQCVPPGIPWEKSPVGVEQGIRGLEGVTLAVRSLQPTSDVLAEVMGFSKAGEYSEGGHRATIFELGLGGPGTEVRLVEQPDLPHHRMIGAGGVHHVAFRTPDEEEHVAWRERLAEAGLNVTPVIDRYYFRSIYFREPGGVLFEIATNGPGFTTDEDVEHLGEKLSLPPFLEPHREQIEANLKPIQPVKDGASR